MMSHRRTIRHCPLLLLVTCHWAGAAAAGTFPDVDPARMDWQALEFRASKLLISATAELVIDHRPAVSVADSLIVPAEGRPVMPGPTVTVLDMASEALGRRTEGLLVLDGESGAALQRISYDRRGRLRYRIYRYTDTGAFHRTWWPEDGENELSWQQWSRQEEGMRPFPDTLPPQPVTEPTALLYLVPAGPLFDEGDRMEVLTFARRHVHRVTARVASSERLKYDYVVQPDGERRRGRGEPLRVLLEGRTVDDGDDEDEFELFGLSGAIELFIDPETRAPLAMRGNIKILGEVTFRLQSMRLR